MIKKSAAKSLSIFFFNFLNSVYFAFPYYFTFTLTSLLLESFSYVGFTSKYFFIPSQLIAYFCIALTLILNIFADKTEKSLFFKHFITFIRLLTISLSIVYYIFVSLEESHFDNYVYSQFHVHLEGAANLFYFLIVTTIFSLNFIRILFHKILTIHYKRPSFYSLQVHLELLFTSLFLWILIAHGFSLVRYLYTSLASYQATIKMNYQEKLVRQLGGDEYSGWIASYGEFINDSTPEDAVIFIPPQLESWQMEGNEWYFRWFVYPRKLLGSRKKDDPIPPGAQYMLIAHGTWVWGASDFVWPKYEIPKEKIAWIKRISRKDKKVVQLFDQSYIPNKNLSHEDWGIIKLK